MKLFEIAADKNNPEFLIRYSIKFVTLYVYNNIN